MRRGPRPFRRAEGLQPSNQTLAVADETIEARVEIQLQEQIIGVLITGEVRLNHRRGIRQHVLEPVEKEAMHVREMTGVFVSRPAARRRPPFQDAWRNLPHEWHYDVGRSTQRVNDGTDSIHRLAGVHTQHGPQRSNPDQVMVVVFGIELRAVDKTHRHLETFMEG